MNPDLDLVPWAEWLFGAGLSFAIVVAILTLLGLIVGYLSLVAQYGFGEANDRFIFFLGSVGRDVVAFSPARTLAVARLTMLESWRRWYLLLSLGLFFVFLLLGAWYLDADSEAPAKIYLTTVLPLSSGLILVFGLVFSSIGLWTEFRTKTSLPLITKPVRGGEIVLGRIVGVASICTVLVVVMGVVSYVFVRRGVDHTHAVDLAADQLTLVADTGTGADREYEFETTYDARHAHTLTVNASGRGRTAWRKGHWHPIAPAFDARGLWEIAFDGGAAPAYLVLTGGQADPAAGLSATRPEYQPGGPMPGGATAAGTATVRDEVFTLDVPGDATAALRATGPMTLTGSLELPLPGTKELLLRGQVGAAGGGGQTFVARQIVAASETPWRLRVGPHQGMLEARVPIYAPAVWDGKLGFYFTDRQGAPKVQGINVGKEWNYRGYIEGDTGASAIWTFEGITEERFPDELPIELDIRVFRSRKGDIEQTIRGSLQLQAIDDNGLAGARSFERGFNSQEFTLQRIVFPGTFPSADGKETLDLHGDIIKKGRLQVILRCEERGQYFGAARRDLYIRAADHSFAWNFAKAYFGLWLQMIVMVCLGTLFSTRLHFVIAMMASAFVLLIGLYESFVAGVYKGILIKLGKDYPWVETTIQRLNLRSTVLANVDASEQQYGGGMIESTIRILRQTNLETNLELPVWVMGTIQWVDFFFATVTYLVTWLIPDLEIFSLGDLLAQGRDINSNILGRQFGIAIGYLVVLPIFGYFLLRTREVAQ